MRVICFYHIQFMAGVSTIPPSELPLKQTSSLTTSVPESDSSKIVSNLIQKGENAPTIISKL